MEQINANKIDTTNQIRHSYPATHQQQQQQYHYNQSSIIEK
jgi:hypothetical protein